MRLRLRVNSVICFTANILSYDCCYTTLVRLLSHYCRTTPVVRMKTALEIATGISNSIVMRSKTILLITLYCDSISLSANLVNCVSVIRMTKTCNKIEIGQLFFNFVTFFGHTVVSPFFKTLLAKLSCVQNIYT